MPRLSQTEKYAIQGMLHASKSVDEIADTLHVTSKTVQKYIDGELNKIHETIARIQTEKVIEAIKEEPAPVPPITNIDLTKLKLPRGASKPLINLKTETGKIVSIMTPQASAMGDDFRKQSKPTMSRTAKKNLYDNDGKLKEE